jgi:hypothetical protein
MVRRIITGAVLLCAAAAITTPAGAETPVDGRIVRVVYQIGTKGGTWGFHLANMKDGRYCVRLGNPGRLNLAIIERVANICFDRVPGMVDRSKEQRSRAIDAADGKTKTIVSFQRGSISAAGNDITLEITTCNQVEGNAKLHCFPNRYVVRMSREGCRAEVTLSQGTAGTTTCEHYPAQ